MDREPEISAREDYYLCEDCGASLMGDELVEHRWTEWTEAGRMPCASLSCPACGSEAIAEAHPCNNPDCSRHALDGAVLCEPCFDALVKKYLAFMNGLTPAEQYQVEWWCDGNGLVEVSEKLRKAGEWLDSRL